MHDKNLEPRTSIRVNRRQAVWHLTVTPLAGAALLAGARVSGTGVAQAPATPDVQQACDATPAAGATPLASPVATGDVSMMNDLRFDPAEIVIHAGQSVRWANESSMPHTATGDPDQNPVQATNPEYVVLPDSAEPWGSPLLQPGEEFTQIFTIPGRYEYICIPHVLSGMRGAIVVACAS
jgi:plastocyanin